MEADGTLDRYRPVPQRISDNCASQWHRLGRFSSSDQIWDTAIWIHELSKYATLYPGDVLWMGTQGADGDMVPGDVIEVEISDIGTLKNYIVAED